jgi:hypothetical protein
MAFGAPFPGGGAVTYTFEVAGSQVVGSGVFAGVSFGVAAANRYIVVSVLRFNGGGGTITAVTIGGVSAAEVVTVADATMSAGIWIALVPTGVTGTVALADSVAGSGDYGIMVYAMYAPHSATPNATGTSVANPPTVTLTEPGSGVTIACAAVLAGATPTWTGATLDATVNPAGLTMTGASALTGAGGSTTVKCAFSSTTDPVLAVATWGP